MTDLFQVDSEERRRKEGNMEAIWATDVFCKLQRRDLYHNLLQSLNLLKSTELQVHTSKSSILASIRSICSQDAINLCLTPNCTNPSAILFRRSIVTTDLKY